MSDSNGILGKMGELINSVSAGEKMKITINKEIGIKITTGKPSEIEVFLDSFPDIDELAEVELQELLAECEQKRDQLEADEPDETDEGAHDEWEDWYSDLEEKMDEIEDRLDEYDEESDE